MYLKLIITMTVYESDFLKVEILKDLSLVKMIWLPQTEKMDLEQYQEEFLNYRDIILEYKPEKAIVDTVQMNFRITPDIQEWTNETIFPFLTSRKVAFLVSSDMIVQMGIEQTMEEEEGAKFQTQYFDEYELAQNWILRV